MCLSNWNESRSLIIAVTDRACDALSQIWMNGSLVSIEFPLKWIHLDLSGFNGLNLLLNR